MNTTLLRKLLTEYEAKRNHALSDFEHKRHELYLKNPKLEEIDNKLNSVSIRSIRSLLNSANKEEVLKDLEKITLDLINEKNTILNSLKLDSSYLYPQFECNLCKDTGYIQKNNLSVMCNCLKQKIYDIEYNKANIGNLKNDNFDNFNFNIYSDIPDVQKYNLPVSPRENIKCIYDIAWSFINNFDSPQEKNLFFVGNAGTGKTFLSNCIANELLKKGKTVLYQTAPVMFNTIIDARFNKNNVSEIIDNILNVDLLIIDDLGTETMNSMLFTELFTIINTRLLNQNNHITKTIISSNLDLKSIYSIYNERIGSRLIGYYNICKFIGDDIRIKSIK